MTAPTRRAALGAVLAAGVAASMPAAAAITGFAHSDAELFALQAEIEAADRLRIAAHETLNVAEKVYAARRLPRPPEPDAAAFTKEDWFLAFKEKMAELNAHPSPEWTARTAALEAWQAESDRLQDECGVTAAEANADIAVDAVYELRDLIIATRATTLAGLMFKARYAARFPDDLPDREVMASIGDDLLNLLAMAGEEAAS